MSEISEAAKAKPRVSLASLRLLDKLWPHASRYSHADWRREIVADIFDGWMTPRDMEPMLADGLVYEIKFYDRSAPQGFRHYHSWNPTEKGELALFGPAQAMSAGTAETAQQAQGQGPASAVPQGCAQTPGENP